MEHTSNQAIAKLEKLYKNGKKLADNLEATFSRNQHLFTERDRFAELVASPLASPRKSKPKPHNVQVSMDNFEQDTIVQSEQWINDVFTQLKKVAPQARYRLHFQEANETGYIANRAITPTQQG